MSTPTPTPITLVAALLQIKSLKDEVREARGDAAFAEQELEEKRQENLQLKKEKIGAEQWQAERNRALGHGDSTL